MPCGRKAPFCSLLRDGHEVVFLESSPSNESFKFPPKIVNHFISMPETNLDEELVPMWTLEYSPIMKEMLFGIGDKALIDMLDQHCDQASYTEYCSNLHPQTRLP